MKSYDLLGKFLQESRESVGVTQSEVAKLCGYSSPQFISNAERGLCRLPFDAISKMVRLYKVDPEKIIELLLKQHEEHYREVFKKELAARKRRRA